LPIRSRLIASDAYLPAHAAIAFTLRHFAISLFDADIFTPPRHYSGFRHRSPSFARRFSDYAISLFSPFPLSDLSFSAAADVLPSPP